MNRSRTFNDRRRCRSPSARFCRRTLRYSIYWTSARNRRRLADCDSHERKIRKRENRFSGKRATVAKSSESSIGNALNRNVYFAESAKERNYSKEKLGNFASVKKKKKKKIKTQSLKLLSLPKKTQKKAVKI